MRCNYRGGSICSNSTSLKPAGLNHYKLCDVHREFQRKRNQLLREGKENELKSESKELKQPLIQEPDDFREPQTNVCQTVQAFPVIVNPIIVDQKEKDNDIVPQTKEQKIESFLKLENSTINPISKTIELKAEDEYLKLYINLRNHSIGDDTFEECPLLKKLKSSTDYNIVENAFEHARYENEPEIWKKFFHDTASIAPQAPFPLRQEHYAPGYVLSLVIVNKELSSQAFFFKDPLFELDGDNKMYLWCILHIYTNKGTYKTPIYIPASVYLWFCNRRKTKLWLNHEKHQQNFEDHIEYKKNSIMASLYPVGYDKKWMERYAELFYELTMDVHWNRKKMDIEEVDSIITKLQDFEKNQITHQFFPEHFVSKFHDFLEQIQNI
jgi:hypothetical protein